MVPLVRGERVAPKVPSRAAPSPWAPSSNIGEVEKFGGVAVVALRKKRVTVGALVSSSRMRAVIVMGWVDLGTGGEWETLRMSGATLPWRTELGSPGVPPTGRLACQFWPLLLSSAAWMSSR